MAFPSDPSNSTQHIQSISNGFGKTDPLDQNTSVNDNVNHSIIPNGQQRISQGINPINAVSQNTIQLPRNVDHTSTNGTNTNGIDQHSTIVTNNSINRHSKINTNDINRHSKIDINQLPSQLTQQRFPSNSDDEVAPTTTTRRQTSANRPVPYIAWDKTEAAKEVSKYFNHILDIKYFKYNAHNAFDSFLPEQDHVSMITNNRQAFLKLKDTLSNPKNSPLNLTKYARKNIANMDIIALNQFSALTIILKGFGIDPARQCAALINKRSMIQMIKTLFNHNDYKTDIRFLKQIKNQIIYNCGYEDSHQFRAFQKLCIFSNEHNLMHNKLIHKRKTLCTCVSI